MIWRDQTQHLQLLLVIIASSIIGTLCLFFLLLRDFGVIFILVSPCRVSRLNIIHLHIFLDLGFHLISRLGRIIAFVL